MILDSICTFEVTGNDTQDVDLCFIHGIFNTDSPKGTCKINEIKLFTAIVEFSDESYSTNGVLGATGRISKKQDLARGVKPMPEFDSDHQGMVPRVSDPAKPLQEHYHQLHQGELWRGNRLERRQMMITI